MHSTQYSADDNFTTISSISLKPLQEILNRWAIVAQIRLLQEIPLVLCRLEFTKKLTLTLVINRNSFIKTLGNTVTLVAGTETNSGVIWCHPTAVIPHSITHTAVNPRAPPG